MPFSEPDGHPTACSEAVSAADSHIPLAEPLLGGNEWKYVKACLDSGWVSSVGPFVGQFEKEVANYVGARHAVATASGTAALHVALRVAGVEPGDEVIVPTLTFVAPVNAVRYCQAFPVLVDADPATWQIDPSKVEQFLAEECELREAECYNRGSGRRVRALLAVHLLGGACEIDRLGACARKWHLRVIEDAAEAMGVRYKGRYAGTCSDIGVFSFNGNKIVTTGGGGMVVTDDAALAEYARYLTTQAKDDPLEYVHKEVGYNYRLSNVQAAIGLAQLEQLDTFLLKKRAIAVAYQRALGELKGLMPMQTLPGCEPTHWLWTFLLPETTTLAQRKAVIARLNASGIGARPLWHPIHGLPPYRDFQAYRIDHAVRLYERAISLPSGVRLTEEQLQRCIDEVARSIALPSDMRASS